MIAQTLRRRIDFRTYRTFLRELQFALLRSRLGFLNSLNRVRMAPLRLFHFGAFRFGCLAVLLGLLRLLLAIRVIYGIEVFLRLDSHFRKDTANSRFIVPAWHCFRRPTRR